MFVLINFPVHFRSFNNFMHSMENKEYIFKVVSVSQMQ